MFLQSTKLIAILALLSFFYLANISYVPSYLAAQQPSNPSLSCHSWAVVSLHQHQALPEARSLDHWCLLVLGQLDTSPTSHNYFS